MASADYTCRHCGRSRDSREGLDSHLRIVHQEVDGRQIAATSDYTWGAGDYTPPEPTAEKPPVRTRGSKFYYFYTTVTPGTGWAPVIHQLDMEVPGGPEPIATLDRARELAEAARRGTSPSAMDRVLTSYGIRVPTEPLEAELAEAVEKADEALPETPEPPERDWSRPPRCDDCDESTVEDSTVAVRPDLGRLLCDFCAGERSK